MNRYIAPIAIAIALAIPGTAIAQTKTMVSVDRATLTAAQSAALSRLIPQLPRTQVGKQCQYYGKPSIWCLLLDAGTASQVQQQLAEAGIPAQTREVSPLRRRSRR